MEIISFFSKDHLITGIISVTGTVLSTYILRLISSLDFAALKIRLLNHKLQVKVKSNEEEKTIKIRFRNFKIEVYEPFYTEFPKILTISRS